MAAEDKLIYTSAYSKKLISSLKCSQKHCGTIEKFSKINAEVASGRYYFEGSYFSEEGTGEQMCANSQYTGYFVTHFDCSGDHCDDKRLHCKKLGSNAGIQLTDLYEWTTWFTSGQYNSEKASCPHDYYLVGLQCQNGWCSRMRMKCRKIEVCTLSIAHFSITEKNRNLTIVFIADCTSIHRSNSLEAICAVK